ncbi:MAG: ATP-binding protein [Thermodesulfovibrionales bacterium]
MLISLITTITALLLSGIILGTREVIIFRRTLVNELTVQARMISTNCAPDLLFGDQKAAAETLSALGASPHVELAAIYATDGELFATYRRSDVNIALLPSLPAEEGYRFYRSHLVLYQHIVSKQKKLGSIYIWSDLRELYGRLVWYAFALLGVIIFSSLVALMIFSRLQKAITTPLLNLTKLMRDISADKDYSVRTNVESHDEIGVLSGGFNSMLQQIQIRDDELELERKQLENLIAKRTASLVHTKEQLEGELVNRIRAEEKRKSLEEQLYQSQKMEAIGTLAGGIAHDFNNLLTVIIGYGNLIRMRLDDNDPTKSQIHAILDASDRATELTRGLLAYSRKQPLSLKPLNINETVDNMRKMFVRILGEDIEKRVVLAEEDLIIMGDSGQIGQVLLNLAANARDAMPDGGVLTISTTHIEISNEFIGKYKFERPGPYACITFTDAGGGMDDKIKERIFDPFFTTKELGRGTGLGLSIVYGIIKQHSGYIICESAIGKGTTFSVYFPLIEAQLNAEEEGASSPSKRGDETILLAEDNESVRTFNRDLLVSFGYQVIEAVDGEDAVNKFERNKDRIQLLLLDVIMPKKNGKEAHDAIRSMRPDIKTIFISGYSFDIVKQKGLIDEGATLISKPVAPEALLGSIREILDK